MSPAAQSTGAEGALLYDGRVGSLQLTRLSAAPISAMAASA